MVVEVPGTLVVGLTVPESQAATARTTRVARTRRLRITTPEGNAVMGVSCEALS